MSATVSKDTCSGCGDCVSACPLDAIAMNDGKAAVDEGTCGDCGACIDVCPTESITLG